MASAEQFFLPHLCPAPLRRPIFPHGGTSSFLLVQCLGHEFYSTVLEVKKVPTSDHHGIYGKNGTDGTEPNCLTKEE